MDAESDVSGSSIGISPGISVFEAVKTGIIALYLPTLDHPGREIRPLEEKSEGRQTPSGAVFQQPVRASCKDTGPKAKI